MSLTRKDRSACAQTSTGQKPLRVPGQPDVLPKWASVVLSIIRDSEQGGP